MLIGLDGAIGSTVVAGTELMARGMAPRIGMVTETGRMPATKEASNGERPLISTVLGLPPLERIRFGGWDIRSYSVAEAAAKERVVPHELASRVHDALDAIRPAEAVLCEAGAPICAHGRREHKTLRHAVEAIRGDIHAFREASGARDIVIVDVTPTAPAPHPSAAHDDLGRFEAALEGHDISITPNMLYFYAACQERCPYVNFTPNPTEVPSLARLAVERRVPYAGRDGKTGQTFVKTALAPALRERQLHIRGWYSTNILGNGDGRALADPAAAATKIATKSSVLDSILGYPVVSESGEPTHVVAIHYYPPRGDAKESWDNIDLEGFLGSPMQLKLNFLCRDSILAAPLVLDLARLAAHARKRDEAGALDYLSMFFKSPIPAAGRDVIHDFFEQVDMFERYLATQALGRFDGQHARREDRPAEPS
jgi:myo-inositol-1-phosphate synthase